MVSCMPVVWPMQIHVHTADAAAYQIQVHAVAGYRQAV